MGEDLQPGDSMGNDPQARELQSALARVQALETSLPQDCHLGSPDAQEVPGQQLPHLQPPIPLASDDFAPD